MYIMYVMLLHVDMLHFEKKKKKTSGNDVICRKGPNSYHSIINYNIRITKLDIYIYMFLLIK